jgi:hypothetical protein
LHALLALLALDAFGALRPHWPRSDCTALAVSLVTGTEWFLSLCPSNSRLAAPAEHEMTAATMIAVMMLFMISPIVQRAAALLTAIWSVLLVYG